VFKRKLALHVSSTPKGKSMKTISIAQMVDPLLKELLDDGRAVLVRRGGKHFLFLKERSLREIYNAMCVLAAVSAPKGEDVGKTEVSAAERILLDHFQREARAILGRPDFRVTPALFCDASLARMPLLGEEWLRISEQDAIAALKLGHDVNPIHRSDRAAIARGFPRKIVSGAILPTRVVGLITKSYQPRAIVTMHLDVQFTGHVCAGEQVRLGIYIARQRKSWIGAEVVTHVVVGKKGNERVIKGIVEGIPG